VHTICAAPATLEAPNRRIGGGAVGEYGMAVHDELAVEELLRHKDSATVKRVRALLATGSPIQRAMAVALLTERLEVDR
jgi:hypothetical protein